MEKEQLLWKMSSCHGKGAVVMEKEQLSWKMSSCHGKGAVVMEKEQLSWKRARNSSHESKAKVLSVPPVNFPTVFQEQKEQFFVTMAKQNQDLVCQLSIVS